MTDIHFRIPCTTDMEAFVDWMDEHCPKWFINYQVGFANLVYSLPNREQLSVKGMLVEAAQLGNQFTNYGFPGMSFLELVTTSPKQCMLAKLTWC